MSPFAVLFGSWALLLARWCCQEDVVVGARWTRRLQNGELRVEGLDGPVPLRLAVDEHTPVNEFLKRADSVLTQTVAHSGVSMSDVCSAIQRSDDKDTLLRALIALDDDRTRTVRQLAGEAAQLESSPVELAFVVEEVDGIWTGVFQYRTDLFDRDTVSRMADSCYTLLHGIVKHTRRPVGQLGLLSGAQRDRVIYENNATAADYPRGKLIHELFEAQVRKTPQAIAVAYKDEQLTYEQLDARANQLAGYLRERGVGPDELVGICVERSLEMAVGLLAILKAGGAYVPLDPSYPRERLEYMLKDASPKVLLTLDRLTSRLPETTAEVIAVDADWQKIAARPTADVESRKMGLHSGNLAYVIYTSGSTGQPKGVLVEHGSVINLWGSLERLYRQSAPCKHVALNASLNFDASVQQLVQLLSGRRLSIVPQEYRLAAHELLDFIEAHRIDAIDCTPSQLKLWVDAGMLERTYPHMVLVGGEPIDAELWRRLAHCTGKQFFNVYGPTECTVDVTACRLDPDGEPSIGRPLNNTHIYILDACGQPVPIGVTGELYIGGRAVARGYLNRAELTAERFVRDPFTADATARMYRTGDLGRWRADGTIEHLGRNDDQVKIRGFRIELGEIGSRLSEHELVREAAVIAREFTPGNQRLVAYITAADKRRPDPHSLRTHLTNTLPDYMIPAAFVVLERLPLTQSGKLDRRALPSPSAEDFAKREYAAPRGRMEESLANIWRSLLNTDRIGRDDNFFELGGHSLLLVQLAERLRSEGLSADVFNIYREPTLAGFAAAVTGTGSSAPQIPPNRIPLGCDSISPEMLPLIELDADHIARIVSVVPGGASNIQDIYPLAPLQEGMLFHHQLRAGGSDPYVLPTLLSVASLERLNDVIRAFQGVIDRHDVLRTAILWEDLPTPVQVVYRSAPLPVERIAFDDSRDVREQLDEWLTVERQSMDIRQAPLVRMKIAADPWSEQWYVIIQVHHIGSDEQSMATLLREAMTCLQGRSASLAEPLPYRNHVVRTRALAQSGEPETFFRGKLGDVDETTAPFGLLDTQGDGSSVDEFQATVDLSLGARVRVEARRLGMSPAPLFHAAWALVVAQTSSRDDVVFGTVLLGRMQALASTDRALGMFINTLPMRVALKDLSVRQLVEVTQRELVELLPHEQVSLSVAQRCSAVSGSAPLFTALLNYLHNTLSFDADDGRMGEGVRLLERRQWTNFPILVSVEDKLDRFLVIAQTDREVDPRRIATYLLTAMESLVCALESAPDMQALQLPLLPEAEREQVIRSFNATVMESGSAKLIHELFEEQVARTPDATAVEHEGDALTYQALNQQANQLARYLMSRGVGPDRPVAVCFERGLDMLVGLLGTLKAGGAYLPLDPNYPAERLQQMVADAAPPVVLTQEVLRSKLPSSAAELIVLDTVRAQLAGQSDTNLTSAQTGLRPDHLLYVIYTSGSTGRPKGTAMPHRAMANLLAWHRRELPAAGKRVLQFAAFSFDVAFQEMFSTLCDGGTLVLLDEWIRRDAHALSDFINDQRIDRLFAPPLMLQSVAESCQAIGQVPGHLKDVITAGEQLRVSAEIRGFFGKLPGCRLHNHYGPTETHVVTALTLSGDPQQWPTLPSIGKPIANTQIYVLDARRQPVPIGVAGELYIGGANVARGYLYRDELTSTRFVRDPFSDRPQARLYKTGDLARWRADGTIEYLGRNDDQVKVRGFRIELGEIEAQLARHEAVKEAAVITHEETPGLRRLVAYVVARDSAAGPSVEELRGHLKSLLPDHMVPSAFVLLEQLPLTPSGKLDRRSLPAPAADAYVRQEYEAPQGEVEASLAKIWQEVLKVERVGRNDNFFELGGHSLLAMQVMVRIRSLLTLEIAIRELFDNPVLNSLAARVATQREELMLQRLDAGGADVDALLAQVASMSEHEIDDLMGQLRAGGRL